MQLEKLIKKIRSLKKYIYLGVCFQNSSKIYYYRTVNRSIKRYDVVMVPVTNGPDKPAMVWKVLRCTEQTAPYPVDKTPMISGMAGLKGRLVFRKIRSQLLKAERNYNRTIREYEREQKRARRQDDLGWIDELELFDAIFDDD